MFCDSLSSSKSAFSDMYESYMDILFNLYEFVSVGGYFICDDCPKISVAQRAINDFRDHHHITDPLLKVQGSIDGSYWQKGAPVVLQCFRQWLFSGSSGSPQGFSGSASGSSVVPVVLHKEAVVPRVVPPRIQWFPGRCQWFPPRDLESRNHWILGREPLEPLKNHWWNHWNPGRNHWNHLVY